MIWISSIAAFVQNVIPHNFFKGSDRFLEPMFFGSPMTCSILKRNAYMDVSLQASPFDEAKTSEVI